jgi:sterol desaturase/sphingolipid hydroxylase (fatty acid hydroxylase superfamily)
MSGTLPAVEPWIRLAAFAGLFVLLALAELLGPRRAHALGRRPRWPGNLGLLLLDSLLVRLLFPTAAVGTAILAESQGWGLFGRLSWPALVEGGLAILVLDLAIYLQHVLFHAVPGLWRLHRVHHADLELDLTTGLRFHPLEILLSMLVKLALVAALGAPAWSVLVFEVVLNAGSMFTHSNVRLPAWLEPKLRLVFVTPDMHEIHHSVRREETDSNFGFNLSLWDRLLGTYRAEPKTGRAGLRLGLATFREAGESRLDRLLLQPWRRVVGRGLAGSSPASPARPRSAGRRRGERH